MSPEQARGEKLDGRSDLYSMGVILYQMLTNQVPYTAETPIGVVTKHLIDPVPHAGTVTPNVPPLLEGLAVRLMSKKREQRPDSAMAVFHELEKIEKQMPTSSSGTMLGTTGLAVKAEGSGSIQMKERPLSENELPTQMIDSARLISGVLPRQHPTPLASEFNLEAVTGTRSNLPWAITALVAVAIAGFIAWQSTTDENGLSERLHQSDPVAEAPKEPAQDTPAKAKKQVESTTITLKAPVPKKALIEPPKGSAPVKDGVPAKSAKVAAMVPQKTRSKRAVGTPVVKEAALKATGERPAPAVRRKEKGKHRTKRNPKIAAQTKEKKEEFKALMAKAFSAKSRSNWKGALDWYKRAYQLIPQRSVLKKMGQVQIQLRNQPAACKLFGRYIKGMKGQRRINEISSLAFYRCKFQ
jgi:hypothetical protein